MADIRVELGERAYTITVEPGALGRLGDIVAGTRPTGVLVVSNPVVARHYGEATIKSLTEAGIQAHLFCVSAGERFKTLTTVKKIYDSLLQARIDRKGAIVALGGGVIGDMAGFAAATYLRGIDFHQVPTTLLAQVDASVGGKVAVDLPQGKNLVGAFHQPRSVVIDTHTLNTLPARELRCGLAEMVKHGIIYDQEYLSFLNNNAAHLLKRREVEMVLAVERSVEIKRDIVVADERESGLRGILNYGHTVGHAVEMLGGYGRYRHGEAVSIGMVTEALLAERESVAKPGLAKEVAESLKRMRLPINLDVSQPTAEIVRAIELDKKTLGGVFRLALPSRIGECSIVEISRHSLAGAIDAHKAMQL
ncbi:MAG: 3-dehydroquinate synthase [Armatimonadota bacterium]|jgi:3-dehydroquinate synthase